MLGLRPTHLRLRRVVPRVGASVGSTCSAPSAAARERQVQGSCDALMATTLSCLWAKSPRLSPPQCPNCLGKCVSPGRVVAAEHVPRRATRCQQYRVAWLGSGRCQPDHFGHRTGVRCGDLMDWHFRRVAPTLRRSGLDPAPTIRPRAQPVRRSDDQFIKLLAPSPNHPRSFNALVRCEARSGRMPIGGLWNRRRTEHPRSSPPRRFDGPRNEGSQSLPHRPGRHSVRTGRVPQQWAFAMLWQRMD